MIAIDISTTPTTAAWLLCWRDGIAPQLANRQLQALRDALASDDPRLVQGATTTPPPLQCVADWPVEAADAIAFTGWQDGLETVGEVEEFFARMCFECDYRIGEPAACRHFIRWWDETPRPEVFKALLAEVEATLASR
jgi:hypothetical protein